MCSGSHAVAALLNSVTEEYDRIGIHGVRTALLERQAKALDLPLEKIFISMKPSNEEYEARWSLELRGPVTATCFRDKSGERSG